MGVENHVCIATFHNDIEADIAHGLLETNGIESIITADDCAGLRPHLTFITAGVKLLVDQAVAEQAKAILDQPLEIAGEEEE